LSNEEIRQRIVDRSRGHVPVDPNTLHPPAFSPDSTGTFEWHAPKPYTCWWSSLARSATTRRASRWPAM
jgi:hypothetical protein